MVAKLLASASKFTCHRLKNNFFSTPILARLLFLKSYYHHGPSLRDVCKVFFGRTAGPPYEKQKFLFVEHQWIHYSRFLRIDDKDVESAEHCGNNIIGDDAKGSAKVKRKKLKGKRAVVKWLKYLRWKKKKEYERMTVEEKILYKLKKARMKEERYVRALGKIEPKDSRETTHDPEILTPEEHFFFLKMGLKCKNYVPIGRRGIYQGVILNMHLHWKKHQTLQVVVKTFTPDEVKEIAAELARLSGGIVLHIHEEDTIIMYRGKNYSQPPTEMMLPRVTLPRKKALDRSKYREGLRNVRRYIPRLEQDLDLLQARYKRETVLKAEVDEDFCKEADTDSTDSAANIKQQVENSNQLKEMMAGNDDCSEEEDSEALSDIFETDSDSEVEKEEEPLYLNLFDKFPIKSDQEQESFGEHLRQICADSEGAKSSGKDDNPELDEADKVFLRAASLLRKKRR